MSENAVAVQVPDLALAVAQLRRHREDAEWLRLELGPLAVYAPFTTHTSRKLGDLYRMRKGIELLEGTIRQLALAEYAWSGNRQPTAGVEVVGEPPVVEVRIAENLAAVLGPNPVDEEVPF